MPSRCGTRPIAAGAAVALLIALASAASADPAPRPIDAKELQELRDKAVVLQDPRGGIYVVFRVEKPRVFYGPSAKSLYEQLIIGSSWDGEAWEFDTWAPRVAEGHHLGTILRRKYGSYEKTCRGSDDLDLTELAADKAKLVLDRAAFLTMGTVRVAHLLARDDHGVYYYVDRLAKIYGGKGYRVFVGKKGALKQMPLTDVASDSAGEVFSTPTGDLRLVRNAENNKQTMTWVKGEKRTDLVFLDVDDNSVVIYKDLGLYGFLGTVCDNA